MAQAFDAAGWPSRKKDELRLVGLCIGKVMHLNQRRYVTPLNNTLTVDGFNAAVDLDLTDKEKNI